MPGSSRTKMISAISWVPKGIAKSVPSVAQPPSREEIEEMSKSAALEIGDDDHEDENDDGEDMDAADKQDQEIKHASTVAEEFLGKCPDNIIEALKELDMDNYDNEEDGIALFGKGIGDSYYPSNELDPYLVNNEDSEEEEDMAIRPEDSVIVCARVVENGVSKLKVYILENTEDGPNLNFHHNISISAPPITTEWLDFAKSDGEKGNFIAVGTTKPGIEIWDLDIIDEAHPRLTLGGVLKANDNGSKEYRKGSHTRSVISLAWNKEIRNVLASASADKLVKLWDLSTGECDSTMDHHTDKVVAVGWNHHIPQLLLTGSLDQTVVMKDARQPNSHSGYKWPVDAVVESLTWDPHNQHCFVVSLENGMVQAFDIRTLTTNSDQQKPSFTIHAHHKAVSSVCYNPAAPNLLATGSEDKLVKLWDLSNNQPCCIASHNPRAGDVLSVQFSEDSPFTLAVGGSTGKLRIWDTLKEASVSRKFGEYHGAKK